MKKRPVGSNAMKALGYRQVSIYLTRDELAEVRLAFGTSHGMASYIRECALKEIRRQNKKKNNRNMALTIEHD